MNDHVLKVLQNTPRSPRRIGWHSTMVGFGSTRVQGERETWRSIGRPQFSTAKIAFDVTYNLYSGYRERTLGACADLAANRWRVLTFTTKPSHQLPRVTPFVTRLCPQGL